MKEYVIGADVGGTTIKFGSFDKEGNLIEKWNIRTVIEDGGSHIIPDIAESIREKIMGYSDAGLKGIGIGLPGGVDREGICLSAVNLNWDRPSDPAGELTKLLGVPASAANDANAAALGEAWKGAGEGHKDIVFVGLGTGIGCGIILNGKILAGSHGLAGEMGHLKMDDNASEICACGNTGCIERYASANGMARLAMNMLAEEGLSPEEVYGVSKVTSSVLFDACRNGNEKACEAADRACDMLGRTIAAAAALVDPEVIVIGGGVVNAGRVLFDRLIPSYRKYAFSALKETPVVPAGLGSDAGIYGAAKLSLPD